MLLATQMKRVFILQEKGQQVRLSDPEPTWEAKAVMSFYVNTYPILTTAKITGPVIANDTVEYRFDSVLGTKG